MTVDALWHGRVEELDRDLKRTTALLGQLADLDPDLVGRFRLLLSAARNDLDRLGRATDVGLPVAELWRRLAEADARVRDAVGIQLELIGGAAVRQGPIGQLAGQAEAWLDRLRQDAGLDRPLAVVPGVGPVLEPATGVVRLPFLDWDLWSLPPLARSLGMLAAAQDTNRGGGLAGAAEQLAAGIRALHPEGPDNPPVGWEARYLHHLFADMFASGLVGPVYGMAVFALDLDYTPCEPQDEWDGLPTSAQRAAAILATLQAMNRESPGRQPEPYGEITSWLERAWQPLSPAGKAGPLEAAASRFAPWHGLLYDVLRAQLAEQLATTADTWRASRERRVRWLRNGYAGAEPGEVSTSLLGTIWRMRLDNPDQGDALLQAAERALAGQATPLGSAEPGWTPAGVLLSVRQARLAQRWWRLQDLLDTEPMPLSAGPTVVAARFRRLVSEQTWELERSATTTPPGSTTPTAWETLADLEAAADALRQEALDYLGGVLVIERALDREPDMLVGSAPGPGLCALADRMLREYARATGVYWSGRTILGREPLVQTATDLVRIRFPDWSVWNLALLGHEFGHLVSRATPAFQGWRVQSTAGHGEAATLRVQLDELFADAFATYALGPAFACAAIHQFNPAQAYVPRGDHPTHDQRVRAILLVLGTMNEHTRQTPDDKGRYAALIGTLHTRWTEATRAAEATDDGQALLDNLEERVGRIAGTIDRSYRLTIAYTPVRWGWAARIAASLWPAAPTASELRAEAATSGLPTVLAGDLLNSLWVARMDESRAGVDLTGIAAALAQAYLSLEE